MSDSDKSFQLHGQSGGFSDRLNSIFGALDSDKHKPNEAETDCDDGKREVELNSSVEKYTSINRSPHKSPEREDFKKPYSRSHNKNRHSCHNSSRGSASVADHVLHPQNYTKYR